MKLAITTSMRRPELCGSYFKHIDLDEQIIFARHAFTYSKNSGYKRSQKRSRGAKNRDIVLSESLIDPIKELRLQRKRKERLMNADSL